MRTFFIFLRVVSSFVVEPAESVVTSQAEYIGDRVDASPYHIITHVRINGRMRTMQTTYRSDRSSFRPSLTLVADCIRLSIAGQVSSRVRLVLWNTC